MRSMPPPIRWPPWRRSRCRPAAEPDWRTFLAMFRAYVRSQRMAHRPRARYALVRTPPPAPVRRRTRAAEGPSAQLHQIASTYSSRERFLTEMALDPPDATSDEAGAAGKGRRLPDPVDDSLGQGAGMEGGAHPQRHRWLYPVRHGHRNDRGSGGGAASAVRCDDASQGRAAAHACRSASTSTSRRRTAIGTSTLRAADSFPRR
jgi:hypothetical protein